MKFIPKKGFTTLELLLVLIFLSLLGGLIIFNIRPKDIFEKSRDTRRSLDLYAIDFSIKTIRENDPLFNIFNYISTNTVYLSLRDTSSTCGSYLSQLPSLPSGWSYRCSATPTAINGQGWIPIPFSSNPLINLDRLPIDSTNKPPYYYTFVFTTTPSRQGYELTALKENRNEEIIVSNFPSRILIFNR